MNAAQRKKQNQLNAKKSTGPRTLRGKEVARANSLRHGLCAKELALPIAGESAEMVQEEKVAWFECLEPDGHDQCEATNTAFLASLKIDRYAKAEAVIVADQIRNAEINFDRDLNHSYDFWKKEFNKDPSLACIELKTKSKGTKWLLGEWVTIRETFARQNCFTSFETIKHALRLLGFCPEKMVVDNEPQEFIARAVACIADPSACAKMRDYAVKQGFVMTRFRDCFPDWDKYDRTQSIAIVRQRIEDEIDALRFLEEQLRDNENAARAAAKVRALVPERTHQNELLMRYARSAGTELDRALKTMIKLKKEQELKAANEPEEATPTTASEPVRNEAEIIAGASASPIHPGAFVYINDKKYEIWESKDDILTLAFMCDVPMWRTYVKPSVDPKVETDPKTGV